MSIKEEDWMTKRWRPMMGWVYMATCTADFVIFPILWSVLQSISHGQVTSQWLTLTLQGAGLYHIAMGAVLGLSAFGRTQEKIAGAVSVSTQTTSLSIDPPTPSLSSTTPISQPTVYNPPTSSNVIPTVTTGFGGKAAPFPAPQPLL